MLLPHHTGQVAVVEQYRQEQLLVVMAAAILAIVLVAANSPWSAVTAG